MSHRIGGGGQAAGRSVGRKQGVTAPGGEPVQGHLLEVETAGGPGTDDAHDLAGHRKRLRERFRKGGPDALPDYELLELILFRAIARADTKPLAKQLIQRFGSFAEVINAPPARLLEVSGVGERVIDELALVRSASLRVMKAGVIAKPALSSWVELMAYLRAAQGYAEREQFRILFLDKKNRLIADEVRGEGTVDHTPVYIREVVKRALELSASAIILVHNHPDYPPPITFAHA